MTTNLPTAVAVAAELEYTVEASCETTAHVVVGEKRKIPEVNSSDALQVNDTSKTIVSIGAMRDASDGLFSVKVDHQDDTMVINKVGGGFPLFHPAMVASPGGVANMAKPICVLQKNPAPPVLSSNRISLVTENTCHTHSTPGSGSSVTSVASDTCSKSSKPADGIPEAKALVTLHLTEKKDGGAGWERK